MPFLLSPVCNEGNTHRTAVATKSVPGIYATLLLEYQKITLIITLQVPIEACEYNDSGLYEGNDYQYRVCAVNQVGNGPPSTGSDMFKAQNPIDG